MKRKTPVKAGRIYERRDLHEAEGPERRQTDEGTVGAEPARPMREIFAGNYFPGRNFSYVVE